MLPESFSPQILLLYYLDSSIAWESSALVDIKIAVRLRFWRLDFRGGYLGCLFGDYGFEIWCAT